MTCLHCGAETTNGLALCELCQRLAADCFELLPVYFRNLARWKPGRGGSRQVPGSRVLYDGEERTGDRIANALDEALNALTTWARALEDDRGIDAPIATTEAEQVEALCAWLRDHLTSIATLDWAGELLRRKRKDEATCDSIGYHEWRLRLLTESAAPGWYAGACRRKVSLTETCGYPTFVVPGLTWVTCGACGATTYARDHLDAIIDEASTWRARPMRLAEAIVALVDTEASVPRLHKRISKWGERGRIEAVDRLGYRREFNYAGEQYAPKQFRFGEVMEALLVEGATRLADDETAEVG